MRLEACIMELEREKNDVLIIAHETVLRCLYAYLFDRPDQEIPSIHIPRNYLIEIKPSAYGCRETRLEIQLQQHDSDEDEVLINESWEQHNHSIAQYEASLSTPQHQF